ncbi:MAG: alpha/beta hydrolase [Xanthobacteraceae bacterium]
MNSDVNATAKLNRRALVGSVAAAALAGGTSRASAQRCPPVDPNRAKGPPVWMDMDQQEIDDAYDNDVYAFNGKNVLERQNANNEIAASRVGRPIRLAYGATPIEMLDLYKCAQADAPTMIFIHGGSWRSGRASQFAVYAEPFIKARANFIALDFTDVRSTNGDLFPMVDQCRRAVSWIYGNAASFGIQPDKLFLCSRSSGSHLAGCVVTTEWEKQGLPLNVIKGGVLGSGMYDLKPVRLSLRSKFVKFTDEMEQELSPLRHIDKLHTPLVLVVGSLETPEFQRQARDFAAAILGAGKPAKLVIAKGYNHYEVGETLGNPYAVLGRAAMDMMGLNS